MYKIESAPELYAHAIALVAEKRAQVFFERVFMTADDPALRGLAQEMAMEEREHVVMLERLLERTPEPAVDWNAVFETHAIRTKGGSDV